MPKLRAVCMRCGEFKRDALRVCEKCGFLPKEAQESAKSLLLSECFDLGEEVIGLTKSELAQASEAIKSGNAYHFDEIELSKVTSEYLQAKSMPPRRLITDIAKWLAPPIILLVLFIVMSFLTRR